MAKTKLEIRTELRERIDNNVKKYNEFIQSRKFDKAVKADEDIQKDITEYTEIARTECFEELKAEPDPMMAAINKLTYPTIRIKDSKTGEDKIPVRTVEAIERPIDLLRLHKFCGGKIGKQENWNHYVEKLNFLLTAKKAVDLGYKDLSVIHDSYAMSEISKEIDMGKTPTSNTQLLKCLQMVIDTMIGEEFKATSHDVAFLNSVYSKKNRKALTVTCSNHRHLRQYIMEICHRIVTGKSYAIEYKQIKR